MKPGRGLVVEVKEKTCILFTADGRFLEVPLPRKGTEIGQEIIINRSLVSRIIPFLAAASFLLTFLAWALFNLFVPRAAAYIALDINPSIELGVNEREYIISARGLNADGNWLLQKVRVVKLPLEEGLQKIIAGAVKYRYLEPGAGNIILATVTDTGSEFDIEISEIYQFIHKQVKYQGISAELVVAEVDKELYRQARDKGVTPGRYLLQREAGRKGIHITDKELQTAKIRELEKKKKIKASELVKNRYNGEQPKQRVEKKPALSKDRVKPESASSHEDLPRDGIKGAGESNPAKRAGLEEGRAKGDGQNKLRKHGKEKDKSVQHDRSAGDKERSRAKVNSRAQAR